VIIRDAPPPSHPDRGDSAAGGEGLARQGEEALLAHLVSKACEARDAYGGIHAGNLEALLQDRRFVRHPTRIVYERGEMAAHQFAHAAPDWREEGGWIIHLLPALRTMPGLAPHAAAYMIPVINYGEDVVDDEHCLAYGAALLAVGVEEYYDLLCRLADEVGAEERFEGGHSCGCGCGG